MCTRFTKPTLIVALIVAGIGAAHAEGPNDPNLAVEGGVSDLGHTDNAADKLELRGVFRDAVGSYAFAPRWSLVGIGNARANASDGDEPSAALKAGAGLQYELSKRVSLLAEYEHYTYSDALEAKPRLGEFSLGFKVGF